uniref:Uncharacterized protein n=1 Tax=Rhizophora mucronata TaxID=61149 RepID=A0A2P2MHK5_RHIMU
MALVSGSLRCCPGLARACYPKLLFGIGRHNEIRFDDCSAIRLASRRVGWPFIFLLFVWVFIFC